MFSDIIIPITTNYGDSTNDLNIWKQDYNQNWNIVRDDGNDNIVKEMVGPEEGSYVNIKAKIDSLL